MQSEPTRFWGNLASAVMAAAVAAPTTLPSPWGWAVSGVLILASIGLTEYNRSKVTPIAAAK